MYFGAVLYISGLRCLIRDDRLFGKKFDPHLEAQSDKAITKAF
jgi:hypothetical protein